MGLCFAVLVLLLVVSAGAQSTAVPPDLATQIMGVSTNTPNPENPPTAPLGGIVLYGSGINPATGRPWRHFWVGDTNFGLCRVDPDIDTGMATLLANLALNPQGPSPFNININQCPFKINGSSVTGGPMAFDPTNNFLYFADEQNSSQGIFRMGFLPGADSGHGSLDFGNLFGMGGNPTGSRFSGGQSGCSFPTDSTVSLNPPAGRPNGVALSPNGDLYVGFKRTGAIIRFNSPATATTQGFGTCNDFVQLVAATPGRSRGNGIAFIGHDLWGAGEAGAFFISNADTTCEALSETPIQNPVCPDVSPAALAIAPTAVYSDQLYPNLNGDNLYMGSGTDAIWAGNVTAGAAGASPFIVANPFEPALAFGTAPPPAAPGTPAVVNGNGVFADMDDPANNVMYIGLDPSGNATLAKGQWWRVEQNPSPAAAPGTPTQVRAVAGLASSPTPQATVSWAPAQNAQTVNSYTVQVVSGGVIVNTVVVAAPVPGGPVPNFTTIGGLTNGTAYTFEVAASNRNGTSPFSADSNSVTPPLVRVPGIPTNVSAVAGDQAALISWIAPVFQGDSPITGYTVTVIANNVRTATTFNAPASATSLIANGLTNGTTYEFVVHANNLSNAGTPQAGMDSTPSNDVIPAAQANPVTVTVNGPPAPTVVPTQVTFSVTVTNNTQFPYTSASMTLTLTQANVDGAYLVLSQPSQGSCTAGGNGVTTIACPIGTLPGLGKVTYNVIVQIQGNPATLNATFGGTDVNGNVVSPSNSFTLTPAPPTSTTDLQLNGSASNGGPTVTGVPGGAPDTFTWKVKNNTSTTANAVVFSNTMPRSLKFDSVSLSPAGLGTCTAPAAGTLGATVTCNISVFGIGVNTNQFQVTVNTHVMSAGTITNTGTISFSGTDTNQNNNKSTVTLNAR